MGILARLASRSRAVAGLLMWVPGGLVHMAVALTLLAAMLHANERSVEKRALEKNGAANAERLSH